MTSWSVHVRTGAPELGPLPTEQLHGMHHVLGGYAGVATLDEDHAGYSARLTLSAPDPAEAVRLAIRVAYYAAAEAGYPRLPVVAVEVQTEGELESAAAIAHVPLTAPALP